MYSKCNFSFCVHQPFSTALTKPGFYTNICVDCRTQLFVFSIHLLLQNLDFTPIFVWTVELSYLSQHPLTLTTPGFYSNIEVSTVELSYLFQHPLTLTKPVFYSNIEVWTVEPNFITLIFLPRMRKKNLQSITLGLQNIQVYRRKQENTHNRNRRIQMHRNRISGATPMSW